MALIDPCLREELRDEASDLGWKLIDFDFHALESTDWGELKNEIREKREVNELIHYRFSGSELDRKASKDHRIDSFIITDKAPEEATVKNLSENSIAVILDFSTLLNSSRKRKNAVLSEWRRTFFLADKKQVKVYISSGAEDRFELRPPEMLESFIRSLGGELGSPEDKVIDNKKKLESDRR